MEQYALVPFSSVVLIGISQISNEGTATMFLGNLWFSASVLKWEKVNEGTRQDGVMEIGHKPEKQSSGPIYYSTPLKSKV